MASKSSKKKSRYEASVSLSFVFNAAVALVVLMSGISCSESSESASATVVESEKAKETASHLEDSVENSSVDPVASEFVEQELEQLSSPFTKETESC